MSRRAAGSSERAAFHGSGATAPQCLESATWEGAADLLIVFGSLGCGGTERVVANVANSLSRDGRRICVVTTGAGQDTDFFYLDPAIRRIALSQLRPGFGLRLRTLVMAYVHKSRLIPSLVKVIMHVYGHRINRVREVAVSLGAPVILAMGLGSNVLSLRDRPETRAGLRHGPRKIVVVGPHAVERLVEPSGLDGSASPAPEP